MLVRLESKVVMCKKSLKLVTLTIVRIYYVFEVFYC